MLSQKTIDTVKATAPAVAAHAEAITRNFYERMFREDPQVKVFFNQAHQHTGGQQKALAGAICAYAANIDNLGALGPAVELIAQKHCSLGIKPEHYPIVGKHLLVAIKAVLGDAATDEIIAAWGEAYGLLADVLIKREAEIYEQQAQVQGGWNGYRPLVVERKVRESDIISSFYLRTVDGQPLPPFKPGQYLTLKTDLPTSPRNYSLSDRPGLNHFRISVKREPAPAADAPVGMVSNYLHDQVKEGDQLLVGPPCGEFTLDRDAAADAEPIVLVSGGVGLTPMVSMLKTLAHDGVEAPVYFVHGSRNSAVHALANEVRQICEARQNFHCHFRYDAPLPGDVEHGHCDSTGVVDVDLLKELLPSNAGTFYFCGPRPFMVGLYHGLKQWQVPASRIHFEFFGPKQDLEAAPEAALN